MTNMFTHGAMSSASEHLFHSFIDESIRACGHGKCDSAALAQQLVMVVLAS